jgi:hypothetical protein
MNEPKKEITARLSPKKPLKVIPFRISLSHRAHFLSDFYIAGFASAKCDAILTRDRGIYKKYFQTYSGK